MTTNTAARLTDEVIESKPCVVDEIEFPDHSWFGHGFPVGTDYQIVTLQCRRCCEQKRVSWDDYCTGRYDSAGPSSN